MHEITTMEDVLQHTEAAFSTILAGMRSAITSSEKRINKICNDSNPLLRLPLEILSLIMEEARGEQLDDTREEVRLSHVCRLWRRVAISTCSLWCLFATASYDRLTEKTVERMEVYALRSGKCFIYLNLSVNIVCDRDDNFRKALVILTRNADRLRGLRLALKLQCGPKPDYTVSHAAVGGRDHLSILKGICAPNLRFWDVYLHHHNCARNPDDGSDTIHTGNHERFLLRAPNTRTLTFWATPFSWPASSFSLFENLQVLIIARSYEEEWERASGDDSVPACIPLSQVLSLLKLRILILRGKGLTIRREVPLGPRQTLFLSPLLSLRLPIYLLIDIFKVPREAFEDLENLFLDIPEGCCNDITHPLEVLINYHGVDFFPSLTHLVLYIPETSKAEQVTTCLPLALLTHTITSISIPKGFYDLGEHEGAAFPVWPNLDYMYSCKAPPNPQRIIQSLIRRGLEKRAENKTFVVELSDEELDALYSERRDDMQELSQSVEVRWARDSFDGCYTDYNWLSRLDDDEE